MRLTEHPKTISHIDFVQLQGILPNGKLISLELETAKHCSSGDVTSLLKYSDDNGAIEKGANYNNGVSQYIDLGFKALNRHFDGFIFTIEGNNYFVK